MRDHKGWREGLTPGEVSAVEELMIDGNMTQAYVRAGYSRASAHNNAARFFNRADIAAAVVAATEERGIRTGINADWLLRRLAEEADADVNDLYAEDGTIKPVKEWPLIWRSGLVAGMDVEERRTDDGATVRVTKIKLTDRHKKLEAIGKHVNVQAFRDRIDHGLTPEAAKIASGIAIFALPDNNRDA